MKVRTGPGPLDWRDEGPQTAHVSMNHYAVGAVTGRAMMPIIKGTVLSATREHAADDAHAKADARLRQKYSIHPENRLEYPPGVSGISLDQPRTNPDNGAVKAPITEVHS